MVRKESKPHDIWCVTSLEPKIHDLRQMRQINRQMRQYTVTDLSQ
jgi:hypothetical protein